MANKPDHLHFLGIAGHTMRGIAAAAVELGYTVTGTDPGAKAPGTDWLDQKGITWFSDSDPVHLKGVNRVVISGGTPVDDAELVAAGEQQIPIVSFAAFIGELVGEKRRIVVAGTHGKTTTTSLLAWLFESAGKQPDYVIGIQPRNFSSSVRLSDSKLAIIEGDEYKESSLSETSKFMRYQPDVLVATSLEMDHPDLFTSIDDITARFKELISGMPETGSVYYWSGSPELKQVSEGASAKVMSYGEGADWRADNIVFNATGIAMDAYKNRAYEGHYAIPLFGRHNVDNSLVAIAVALGEGLTPAQINEGCRNFRGGARRFQIVSAPSAKVMVIDDYAHHPTEIATTIEAAQMHFGRRVIAVVRPHTYSRTKELLKEYRAAVTKADVTFITDIEGAREAKAEATVSGEDIVKNNGKNVHYQPDRAQLVKDIQDQVLPDDIIICMTVSGYDNVAEELADNLKV